MLTKMLAATAALSMLTFGGSALAAQAKAAPQVGPKQPIPYSQLDPYLKASPKARATKDWWAGSAETGMSTDTAATTMATPTASGDTAVNPAPEAAPPSLPVTPPTNAPMTEDKMTAPAQPGLTGPPPVAPPVDPK
jgi:hypothetical protein